MPKGRGANHRRRTPRQRRAVWESQHADAETVHHQKMIRAKRGRGVRGPAVCGSKLHPHRVLK